QYATGPPYGIQSAALRRWYEWQLGAIGLLEGTGLAAAVMALFIVSVSSVWRAMLMLAGLVYLTAYPAVQFQIRHFFHLEFIHWMALGFLAQSAISAGTRLVLARRREGAGRPDSASKDVSWAPAARN